MFKGKFRFSDRINFQVSEEAVDFESLCQLVEQENRRCLKENSTAQVTIVAEDKKGRFVYERRIDLPFKNEVEMELLDFFEANKHKQRKIHDNPDNHEDKVDQRITQEIPVPTIEQSESRVSKRVTKKNTKSVMQKVNTFNLKVTVLVAFIFLLFGVGYIVISNVVSVNSQVKEEKVVVSLEALLKEKKYFEAAKQYEDNLNEIENELFQTIINGESDKTITVETLSKFQKKYPTTNGAFDLAFLKGKYEDMIEYYLNHKYRFESDEIRLNLVGYAYLKKNKLDKAKAIAEKVEDVELSKKIASYEVYQQQLTEKEKSIEGVKPTNESELKKYNQTLDEIYELKQKIANL